MNSPKIPITAEEWRTRMTSSLESGAFDLPLYMARAVSTALPVDNVDELLAEVNRLPGLAGRIGNECEPSAAMVGDIGLVDGYLAACAGDAWLVLRNGGVEGVRLSLAQRAWRTNHG